MQPLRARTIFATFRSSILAFMLIGLACVPAAVGAENTDNEALPSWNAGPSRDSIVEFVERVTTPGGEDFVPVPDRIAVFDNDGTLWSEQPAYVQLAYAIDQVKVLAPSHPEWKDEEPFKSILAGDLKSALSGGESAILKVVAETHSGMTTDEFEKTVADWYASARHPETGLLHTEMRYQPMVELLDYLRANDFETYIVSGGGVEFMRPMVESSYGILPEHTIGSRGKLKFEMRDGKPTLVKLPELDFVDDGPGKPVAIQQIIGRKPLAAFGNSDGDLQMLQWTASRQGPSFCLIVHHTDADREWAYDRDSHIGKLDKALDEGTAKGWTIVDMKRDWKVVHPPR